MDTTNSSTNGTNTGSVSSGSLNGFILKLLVFVLSSSVFWVTISVAVLIHFVSRYIVRTRKHESGLKFYPEVENSRDIDRFTGFDYIWEHNHDAFWNNNAENYSVNDPNFREDSAKFNIIQGEKCESFEDGGKFASSLSFRFEDQKPEGFDAVKEEELPISNKPQISNELPISTSLQKYQIAPEKNLRGFIKQPETITISVKELYNELKTEKLASKEEKLEIILEEQIAVETEKPQLEIEPEPKSDVAPKPEFEPDLRIEPESQPEPEVRSELKPEFLSELKPEFDPALVLNHEPESKSESEPVPEPLYGMKSDIELKSGRDSSVGSDSESWSENKPEITNYKEINPAVHFGTNILPSIDDVNANSMEKISDRGTFNPVNERTELENKPSDPEIPLEKKPKRLTKPTPMVNKRKSVRRKRSTQKEMLSEKPKQTSSSSSSSPSTVSSERGKWKQTRRFKSEFSGFDSDSQSSGSDGYSVKDLVVDSDSDWFLSEKDHVKEIEKSREQSLCSSEEDSNDYTMQISYIHHQPDEVSVWLENSSKPELVENESQGNNYEEPKHLKETTTNEDLSKETQTATLSQENVTRNEDLDRETRMATLNQDETRAPVKDSVIEKTTQNKSKEKGKEYLDEEEEEDETQTATLSQENVMRTVATLNQDETKAPVTDSVIDQKATQNKSKDKGKEYLEEEEEDELESLWEHQDLIEQLKMEIKKAKAVGLPTILEESESPSTTIEELKPWHFDEKFLREDPMDELNKFYKSYRERMRKFDILNYQKMYAVGFLQLKNPLESMGSQKPLLPTITSILSQNLYRRRKSTDDPSERFIRELRCDLETVYVGQMCLSWEFLRWQYEKARDMPESDAYRSHVYNQAAGEFQQFQVLINRFVENEPFQGPRLPNYVKNRCVLRNLLQVPVVKEDNLKEKFEDDQKGNYVISSEELEDIMEESIRVFWEFVKADKDETPVILKGLVGPQVELQDPSDYDLMMRLHSVLQKKDKRLKDLLKTGNCLVKKFKKPKEDRSNQDLFFSQVDMKLVSRVLKMPKITSEQLQWCHKKLDMISFVDRKIQREPAFLLFPC